MKIEIIRSINSKTYFYVFVSCILSFVLGYILLISIDHLDTVSLEILQYSVYTVYTQFGFLIFPIIVVFIFTTDYRDKNILFYKTLNINAVKYFLSKLIVTIVLFTFGTLISLLFISAMYWEFSSFLIVFLYFESVLIYIILISSILSFIFKNMLIAFCINLFLWILGIVLSTIHNAFGYLCYYDASMLRHGNFEKFLTTGELNYISILESFSYNLGVFIIVLLLVLIFRVRWEKNGI